MMCPLRCKHSLIVMNRSEFEKLELQVQQSGLPLKSYLQQAGVSYSTYHYWRKKCAAEKEILKQELPPISFKQSAAEPTLGEQIPQGVALLFPNRLRAHFGSGSEKLLMELLTPSLEVGHVYPERYDALFSVSRQDGYAQGHQFAVRSGA